MQVDGGGDKRKEVNNQIKEYSNNIRSDRNGDGYSYNNSCTECSNATLNLKLFKNCLIHLGIG